MPGISHHPSFKSPALYAAPDNPRTPRQFGMGGQSSPAAVDSALQADIILVREKERRVPNTKTAKKQLLVNERNRERNQHYKSVMKTTMKKARNLIESGEDRAEAQTAINKAVRVLHRTASRGIIKRQNASRRISRLMTAFNRQFAPQATEAGAE
jgi:small subunit ribosomal protein S20